MVRSSRLVVLIVGLFLASSPVLPQDKDLAVTIYNDNLGLVKHVRTVQLEKGVSQYSFQDVAALIDPTSVYFVSRTSSDDVTILEQNFEYDLVNSDKILQKYLDQAISISGRDGAEYSGTLLNASGGDVILRESDGGIKIIGKEAIENMAFPELPEGLITRPTLVWSIDCRRSADHDIEVGYLTSGVQWHAEYVGVSDQDDSELELSGWVSIENNSGATYRDAKLRLVAGDVHRARREGIRSVTVQALERRVPEQFEEESFFEYHLYTLQRRATLANQQIKQISLFDPTRVPVEKTYTYDGRVDRSNVRVNLEFRNEESRQLGFPLPKGKVRIYKKDDDETLIFVGEDFIDHTPKDEKVAVFVGYAFDIKAERTQKERRTLGSNSWEEVWQIQLRNHKTAAVSVTIIEHLNADWEILRQTHEFKQRDADTIEFSVSVPANGDVTVEYLVRYTR